MRIRFWGTRGSLPKPGPTTLRYGGNTPCVEVRADDGTLIVLDCGSGCHDLGRALVGRPDRGARGHLLITHTHWDHIQGFPFFAPLRAPGNEWDVYAPQGLADRLETVLAGQMEYSYFPITIDELGGRVRYNELVEDTLDLGGVRVRSQYLNHPVLTLGYRLEADGASFVYSTDHEPHSRHQPPPGGTAQPIHPEDERHVAWMAGADLVVHDAQYTLAEYPTRLGWGHTPVELAVDFAVEAGAHRLALFHHDPTRADDAVDQLVALCRDRAGGALEVFAAAEGQVIELAGRDDVAPPPPILPTEMSGLAGALGEAAARATVLVADDDPDLIHLLTATLKGEGFRLLIAEDGQQALDAARAERPDLILLDWGMPRLDGLQVCRALREGPDPKLRDVPIVLITARAEADATAEGFAAGATDYLTKPFAPAYVRSRVRAWLLRGPQPTG